MGSRQMSPTSLGLYLGFDCDSGIVFKLLQGRIERSGLGLVSFLSGALLAYIDTSMPGVQ